MRHIFSGFSETGAVREINQDSILMKSDGDMGLFCVADGMGGHSEGERASQTIIGCLENWWNSFEKDEFEGDFGRIVFSLSQAIEQANQTIFSMTPPGEICGSTLVALLVFQDKYGIINAGDSRIYMRHKRKVQQATIDDTWENQSDNLLSDKEKMNSANFGKLVNAVGASNQVKLTTRTDMLTPGDTFALCSDGVYKYCTEKLFLKEVKKANGLSLMQTLAKIKENVYTNGARDNLSLILVSTM